MSRLQEDIFNSQVTDEEFCADDLEVYVARNAVFNYEI